MRRALASPIGRPGKIIVIGLNTATCGPKPQPAAHLPTLPSDTRLGRHRLRCHRFGTGWSAPDKVDARRRTRHRDRADRPRHP